MLCSYPRSPATVTTAYDDDDWEDESCLSPVMGNYVHKSSAFQESKGWRDLHSSDSRDTTSTAGEDVSEDAAFIKSSKCDRVSQPDPAGKAARLGSIPVFANEPISYRSDYGRASQYLSATSSLPNRSTKRDRHRLNCRLVSRSWFRDNVCNRLRPEAASERKVLSKKRTRSELKQPSESFNTAFAKFSCSPPISPDKEDTVQAEVSSEKKNQEISNEQTPYNPLHDLVAIREWRDSWQDYVIEMRAFEDGQKKASLEQARPKPAQVIAEVPQSTSHRESSGHQTTNNQHTLPLESRPVYQSGSRNTVTEIGSPRALPSKKQAGTKSKGNLFREDGGTDNAVESPQASSPTLPQCRTPDGNERTKATPPKSWTMQNPALPDDAPTPSAGAEVVSDPTTPKMTVVGQSEIFPKGGTHVHKSRKSPIHGRNESKISVSSVRCGQPPSSPPQRSLPELPDTPPLGSKPSKTRKRKTPSRTVDSVHAHSPNSTKLSLSTLNLPTPHGGAAENTTMKSPVKAMLTKAGATSTDEQGYAAAENVTVNSIRIAPDPVQLAERMGSPSPTSIYSRGSLRSTQARPSLARSPILKNDTTELSMGTAGSRGHSDQRIPGVDGRTFNDQISQFPVAPSSRPTSRASTQDRGVGNLARHGHPNTTRNQPVQDVPHEILGRSKITIVATQTPVSYNSTRPGLTSVSSGVNATPPKVKRSVRKNQPLNHGNGHQVHVESPISTSVGESDGFSKGPSQPLKIIHKPSLPKYSPVTPSGQIYHSPMSVATISRRQPVDIGREISAVTDYMTQLETDRDTQRHEIEGLKQMLTWALRKEYVTATTQSPKIACGNQDRLDRWRSQDGEDRQLHRSNPKKRPRQFDVARPTSDASQASSNTTSSTTGTASTQLTSSSSWTDDRVASLQGTSYNQQVSTTSLGSVSSRLVPPPYAQTQSYPRRVSFEGILVSTEDMDGMLSQLQNSSSMGNLAVYPAPRSIPRTSTTPNSRSITEMGSTLSTNANRRRHRNGLVVDKTAWLRV